MFAPKGTHQHVPTPFIMAFSSAALFTLVALLGPAQESIPVHMRVVLTAVAVAACSLFASAPAAVMIAVMGWLFMKGFLFPQPGKIYWHGMSDATYVLVLVTTALVAVQARRLFARRPGG